MNEWNPKRPPGWEKVRVKRGHPHGPSADLTQAANRSGVAYQQLSDAVMAGELAVTDPDGRELERGNMRGMRIEENDLNTYLRKVGKPEVRLPRKAEQSGQQESLLLDPKKRAALVATAEALRNAVGAPGGSCPRCRGRKY